MSFLYVAAGVAVVTALVGTTVSVVGGIQAGDHAKKVGDYNAAVQRNNALEAQNAANQAAQRKRDEGRAIISRQRAMYAVAGVSPDGTPTEIEIGTAGDIEDDAFLIMQKGEFAYQQGMGEAGFSEAEGEDAQSASYLQAGGTLLSGLGKAAGSMSSAYSPKMTGGGAGGEMSTGGMKQTVNP